MCVISASEKVSVVWIQEVCRIDAPKRRNTVYATVAFDNSEDISGPLFFLLPNALETPRDQTADVLRADNWISVLWSRIGLDTGIRLIDIKDEAVRLAFIADSNQESHPSYTFRPYRGSFSLWPDASMHRVMSAQHVAAPFYVYKTDTLPIGRYIARFSYAVPVSQEGTTEMVFNIRGPKSVESYLTAKVDSISEEGIRRQFDDYLRRVFKCLQGPQYDVICLGNPTDGWTYGVEGEDRHRPQRCGPTFQFSWVNPEEMHPEIPVLARVFAPRTNDFAISLVAKMGKCDYHDRLIKKHGPDGVKKLAQDC